MTRRSALFRHAEVVEHALVLAPVLAYLDVQVEVDAALEKRFHLAPRRPADGLGHAVNAPEAVRKLVLMDSVCFDSWPIPEFEPLQRAEAEAKMSLKAFITMMRGFMPTGVVNKSVMTDEVIDLYLAPWSSEDGKRAVFRNLRRLNKEYTQAIAGALKQLPHPTLVLWGDRDPFQKPAYAAKLAAMIPNAQRVWIKDAGHWLIDEKPDEVGAYLNKMFELRTIKRARWFELDGYRKESAGH